MYDIQYIKKIITKSSNAVVQCKNSTHTNLWIKSNMGETDKTGLYSIEGVKAKFLKKAIGVSKYTQSQLIY